MSRKILTGVLTAILIATSGRGRACEDQAWKALAAQPIAASQAHTPAILKTIAAANWELRSLRSALPPLQLAHNEHLEFQDFTQYAFAGGALRLCVGRGGGQVFALLADTRSPAYRDFAALDSTSRYSVYRHGTSVLILPTRPVSQKLFDGLKSRQWPFGDLRRVVGAPSFRWHVHGVGYSGLTYVPQGLSFILDIEGATDPGLYQLQGGNLGDDLSLPPVESLAQLDYTAVQRDVRDGFANEFLCEREQIERELATGTTSPNGRFVAVPVNLGGLANTQEVVISEHGKPERRYPAPHFIQSNCLWLNNRTILFKIRVPEDAIYSMDVSSGALRELVSDDRGVSEFGVSAPHDVWYTTADGQRHAVAVR